MLEKKDNTSTTTYSEKKIGKTLYRVTSEYKDQVDFKEALKNLIIKKIIRDQRQEKNLL